MYPHNMEKQHLKKNKTAKSKELVKEKLRERKKLSKQALKEKRARLVLKNLPFKATEENLREYFEQYGEVTKVDLLKKDNGKLTGCGFIQYKLVQKAAKAKHHLNGKEFMGRKIVVDFAKPKDKYSKEIKKEPVQVKEESVKEEKSSDIKEESIVVDEIEDDNNEDSENEESENESADESNKVNESEDENNMNVKKQNFESNDVVEGKTIFVKNIPFQATNDDLKQCMLQFGRVYYALICIDKLTEHSKGTGFVKFVNKEDAEKALSAGTELTLLGNVLDCHLALGRNEVQRKVQDKADFKKEPKDSRNLYLVKEGVILAGTKAAEGVSASDMAKRLQIEQYKTQMLRNLNMFVSKERLVVHNIPSNWNDKKLGALFRKYGGPGAFIKEARVMRDMKDVDSKGIGRSKEYGFVAFSNHEHALAALRTLNNNPNIFSPTKRPIITFSIENKKMINAKAKRLEKSIANNQKDKSQQLENNKEQTSTKKGRKRKRSETQAKEINSENEVKEFSGVAAKPGTKDKMRSRYKLTTQAKLHYENLKKEKRKKKFSKKTLKEKKKDFIKQPKQKINKNNKAENDNFSKLVSEYKKKLINAEPSAKKSKWYE